MVGCRPVCRLEQAAVKLQAAWRGQLARRRARRIRAVGTIQMRWRVWAARRELGRLRAARAQREQCAREAAAQEQATAARRRERERERMALALRTQQAKQKLEQQLRGAMRAASQRSHVR
jgi:hypothetical protein